MSPSERGLLCLSLALEIDADKECDVQFDQGEHFVVGFEVDQLKLFLNNLKTGAGICRNS